MVGKQFERFAELCRSLAVAADSRYRRENCAGRLYLYGIKKSGIWQLLYVADESADGFTVTPEPIPWEKTLDALTDWVTRVLRGESLYVFAD